MDIGSSTGPNLRPHVASARATRLNTVPGSLLVVALTATLFTLVPLAHATPVDPTWIAGLYDGADHDDAVLLILDTVAHQGVIAPQILPAGTSGELSASLRSTRPGEPVVGGARDRAPPAYLA